MTDVVVVGAGVIGLTTAVRLAEAGHQVEVWTAEPPQQTTSVVASALCGPNIPQNDERLDRWSRVCAERFRELAEDPATGVHLTRGRLVTSMADELPPWAAKVPGFEPTEVAGFPVAFWAELPTADMPRYLDYLTQRLDISIETRRVTDLRQVPGTVVNCTGTGARDLVPDERMHAVKGQHVIVANPGLDTFFFEAKGAGSTWTAFFPHGDRVVLGGIVLHDDWDLTPDPAVTDAILTRCIEVEPRLADAEVLDVQVGLRPFREPPRLEREQNVIHNYGHAGTGVCWSWGSADDVLSLLEGSRPSRG